jgi:uncharacterized membrane protein
MSDVLREVVLIAATMTMGLMTGVFGIYGNAIMPGLRRTDDRTLVAAFQSIDRAIINPAFMATFVGALAFAGLAALLQLAGDQRPLLPWIAAAFSCTLSYSSSPSASTCPAITRSRPQATSTK